MITEQQDKTEALKTAHVLTEQRFIDGAATLEQLQASQAEIDASAKALHDLERLQAAAESARKKLEADVIAKQRLVNANRVDFCFDTQRRIFEEIRNDKALKDKILRAVAAGAANGHVSYVAEYYAFCQIHGTKFIPEFTREELNLATEKFIKDNNLD
ncbi:hypothetical protein [Nitrosomonas sp.]|uniref:hypothetical protein n=1 Tax=Nitrosomonas sp. TaxID=42353 RepID=UPI001D4258E2|nr:hypothetical protein [Nitrosomonas sp.]MBX3616984.1 hypothetical protein [Nitrosomonas sp.]